MSISKQTRFNSDDTSVEEIALIYGAKKELTDEEKNKLKDWISEKLSMPGIQVFWLKIEDISVISNGK
ncbi:MAG: hypothetical protein HC846_07850 [Blastocatellia bacterium]|nr:hypothetical protein [Blastocatellia bacterium]